MKRTIFFSILCVASLSMTLHGMSAGIGQMPAVRCPKPLKKIIIQNLFTSKKIPELLSFLNNTLAKTDRLSQAHALHGVADDLEEHALLLLLNRCQHFTKLIRQRHIPERYFMPILKMIMFKNNDLHCSIDTEMAIILALDDFYRTKDTNKQILSWLSNAIKTLDKNTFQTYKESKEYLGKSVHFTPFACLHRKNAVCDVLIGEKAVSESLPVCRFFASHGDDSLYNKMIYESVNRNLEDTLKELIVLPRNKRPLILLRTALCALYQGEAGEGLFKTLAEACPQLLRSKFRSSVIYEILDDPNNPQVIGRISDETKEKCKKLLKSCDCYPRSE